MSTTLKGTIGGGVTFSASPAERGDVYVAKGSKPWFCDGWDDRYHIVNIDESVSGQATVTCKNVTTTNYMFAYCKNISSIDLSDFSFYYIRDVSSMFIGCRNLSSIILNGDGFGRTIHMNHMFKDCSSLTTLPDFTLSNTIDTNSMFEGCSSLTTVDISGYGVWRIENMSRMFYGCSNLTSVSIFDFSYNKTKTQDMSGMFYGCSNLTTIKNVIDMSSCTNYNDMFHNCPKLSNVKIGNPPSGFDGAGLSSSQYTIV